MLIDYCLKMILKHMHNALIIFVFSIFLFSCSKSGKDLVEKCADIKTTPYWQSRAFEFAKQYSEWEVRYKTSKDKYEKSANKGMMETKKYYLDLYKNAAKKSLEDKLYEFPLYEKNFEICSKDLFFNPESFKRLYN